MSAGYYYLIIALVLYFVDIFLACFVLCALSSIGIISPIANGGSRLLTAISKILIVLQYLGCSCTIFDSITNSYRAFFPYFSICFFTSSLAIDIFTIVSAMFDMPCIFSCLDKLDMGIFLHAPQ